MTSREAFLERLASEYTWTPEGNASFLVTEYRGQRLSQPVRLHLDEALFNEYLAWMARTSTAGDVGAALGLIFVHFEEAVLADPSGKYLTDVGLERRHLSHPRWLEKRNGQEPMPDRGADAGHLGWVADPPVSSSRSGSRGRPRGARPGPGG